MPTYYGTSENDTLRGSEFGDTFYAYEGNDLLYGEGGGDVMYSDDGNDTLYGGTGNDWMVSSSNNDSSSDNDLLYGEAGTDVMSGGFDDDTLYGGSDNDTLHGGSGNDTIDGGTGIDLATYIFDEGSVTVNLLNGNVSDASGGNDKLISIEQVIGSNFDDTLLGGNGNETLQGGDGNDNIRGRAGNDLIAGDFMEDDGDNFGNDFIHGDDGNDTILGGEGNDNLLGDYGSDNLDGGNGRDFLFGAYIPGPSSGVGEIDTLTGGANSDGFILGSRNNSQVFYDDGNDTTEGANDYAWITDFSSGEDLIHIKYDLNYHELVEGSFGIGDSTVNDTAIYLENTSGGRDELIALVEDVTGLSSGDFYELG